MSSLRPPLPPPLSHEGIAFVMGANSTPGSLDAAEVASIGAALLALLPPGDFVSAGGATSVITAQTPSEPWATAARRDGLRYE